MRTFHKLAALCAVFFMMLTFGITAYAEEAADQPAESVAESTAEDTAEDSAEADSESAAPSEEEIADLLPPGTGTVVDVFDGEDGRKFYTIQTPAGNTFYLIIDFTRQAENVYFLDAVNERDLLALAEQDDTANPNGSTAEISGTNEDSSAASDPATGNQDEPEQNNGGSLYSMVLMVLVVVIGGGAGIYFKVIRKKQNTGSRDEYEADDYEETGPELDEYVQEDGDDSPPWEDDDV